MENLHRQQGEQAADHHLLTAKGGKGSCERLMRITTKTISTDHCLRNVVGIMSLKGRDMYGLVLVVCMYVHAQGIVLSPHFPLPQA